MNEQPRTVRRWISGRLSIELERSLGRLAKLKDVRYLAIMPDVHLADPVCVGTVIATETLVYPAAVGGDIGCGILAIRLNATADRFANPMHAATLMRGLENAIPKNRRGNPLVDQQTELFWKSDCQMHPDLEKVKSREGRYQLGTLGRGNHFWELQADQQQRLWLMIHSGSRAMGQAITNHHLRLATERVPPGRIVAIDSRQDAGQDYLRDVQWARRYAAANRLAMLADSLRLFEHSFEITADPGSLIHTDHNHVQVERHFGQEWLVHRKGAQHLERHQMGLVPGSMGTSSYLVSGLANAASLNSCSHGAGRVMSRTEARRKITGRSFEKSMGDVWYDRRQEHRLIDESPRAYKNIDQVMRDQRDLVSVSTQLRPILSFKGS